MLLLLYLMSRECRQLDAAGKFIVAGQPEQFMNCLYVCGKNHKNKVNPSLKVMAQRI